MYLCGSKATGWLAAFVNEQVEIRQLKPSRAPFHHKSQRFLGHSVAMWPNCSNCRLEPHDPDTSEPTPYLILSHTWGDDGVTFQDMQDLSMASQKKGFQKTTAFYELSSSMGHKYFGLRRAASTTLFWRQPISPSQHHNPRCRDLRKWVLNEAAC